MSTKAGDSHNEFPAGSRRSGLDIPADRAGHGVSGDLDPITTPDSNTHVAPDPEYVQETHPADGKDIARTRTAALWTGLVVGAIVLILLLVFIVQNLDSVAVQIFAWQIDLPLGVSILLAAIAGALVMALVGGVRILQVRRAAKKT